MSQGKGFLVAAGAAAVLLALAAPASAQYPPAGSAACLRIFNAQGQPDDTFRRGEQFSATGNASGNKRCADPDEPVQLSINPVLDTVDADSDGDYVAIGLRIPNTQALGPATVTARTRLNGEPVAYTAAIRIIGDPGRARLPVTGGDIGLLAGWGVAFLAAGTTLTMATRRRLLQRTDGSVIAVNEPPLLIDEDWERSWAASTPSVPPLSVPDPEPYVAPTPPPPAPEPVRQPEPVVEAPPPPPVVAPAPPPVPEQEAVVVEMRPRDPSADFLAQAHRDLEQAESSLIDARYEWACFAAHEAATTAVRALYLATGQPVRSHQLAKALSDLTRPTPPRLVDEARILDTFARAAREPSDEGAPFEQFGELHAEQAIGYARNVLGFVDVQLRR